MSTNKGQTLHPVVTSCGNILRGEYLGLTVETDGKTWLNLINPEDSNTECCVFDAGGDIISDSGEVVTETWTDDDWSKLTETVRASKQLASES